MNLRKSLRTDPIRRLDLSFYTEVQKGMKVQAVIEKMQASHRKCALVMDQGVLKGIFTAHDIRNHINRSGLMSQPIESVMTPDPKTIHGDTSVIEAVKILNDIGYRYMPVVNRDDHVIGTLTHYAIIKYVSDFFPEDIYNLPPEPDQIATSRAGA